MNKDSPKVIRHFLYNPLRQDPEELKQLFVARRPLFERLYSDIVERPPDSVPQHQLIIGQRGMGKTTLLARLALELREKHNDFLPLAFWEEQHIEVDRLSVFWLNCLDSLADALEVAGESTAARDLDKRVDQIKVIKSEDECAREALEAFGEANSRMGRRLVLFIDNFNLLLARLKRHDHVLRSFFTRQGAPIIVGAAITPPADLADYDAAFYDGFKTTLLHRLSLEETKDMIIRLAEENGQAEAVQNMWRELPRLSALRDLSGGNPRTSLLIYRLCAHGFSDDIYRDLDVLLDETTPLFQSRFELLSDQGQKLVARLARHWKPATAETITELTGFPRGTVSPLLGRLEEEGVIEKVSMYDPDRHDSPKQKRGGLSKRVGYQLTERFFNIWIIMRSASRRERAGIMCLSRFLESIYSPAERARYAQELSACASLSWAQAIGARALAETIEHSELLLKADTALLEMVKRGDGELEGLIDPGVMDRRARQVVEVRDLIRAAVPPTAMTSPEEFVNLVMGSPSMLIPNGRSRSVISRIKKGDSVEVDQVANTLRAETKDFVGLIGEEGVSWLQQRVRAGLLTDRANRAEIEDAIGQAENPGVLLFLGEAARELDLTLAERAFQKAIEFRDNDYYTWAQLGIIYHETKRYKEARDAYEKALQFGEGSAAVLANFGQLLAIHFGELVEASKLLRRSSELNPRSFITANNLGACLWLQGGKENAKAAIKEFKRAAAINLSDPKPWISMGSIHWQELKDPVTAETYFRRAISMTSKAPNARTHLGFLLLNAHGKFIEAEEQFKMAIAAGSLEPDCWLGLAGILAEHKNQFIESETAYRRAIEIDPHAHLAWSGLGVLQAQFLGKFDDARVSFTKATELCPSDARYENSLGNLEYDHFRNTEAAETHFKKAMELDPKEDSARHNYAFMLRDTLGRIGEAKEMLATLSQPDAWKDTQALHRALFAAYDQNWGQALEALKCALGEIKNSAFPRNTQDDWHRASAVLLKLGFGSKLLEFLESEGVHDTMMPWFEALKAHVVGDRQMLLNIPAEARDAAGLLFDEIAKRLPLVSMLEIQGSCEAPLGDSGSRRRGR